MLDWIVKNMNTRLPPMKLFLPARALISVPAIAQRITVSFRA